jgi:hypothetical protein
MRWEEFERACPEIAGLAAERFRSRELCMLGSLAPTAQSACSWTRGGELMLR